MTILMIMEIMSTQAATTMVNTSTSNAKVKIGRKSKQLSNIASKLANAKIPKCPNALSRVMRRAPVPTKAEPVLFYS